MPFTIFTGSTKPPPSAMSPSELSQRWPTSPPENLALEVGQWIDSDTAERLLMAANGSTDRETAKCWLNAMLRAGLLDTGEGTKGGCYRLLPEAERSREAKQREQRLDDLRRELEALGVQVGPVPGVGGEGS